MLIKKEWYDKLQKRLQRIKEILLNIGKGRILNITSSTILWISIGAILSVGIIFLGAFQVREVEISGNYLYTNEEIRAMVLKGPLGKNGLYLKGKYEGVQRRLIPFIDDIEIDLLSAYKIRIKVYEKEIVGYLKVKENNIYIDKEGRIVEISPRQFDTVMYIEGVKVKNVGLYEKLSLSTQKQMAYISQIDDMLKSNGMRPEKLVFNGSNTTLVYQDVFVELGGVDFLKEKLATFITIYPKIEGKKGILHMEKYTNITKTITFEEEAAQE